MDAKKLSEKERTLLDALKSAIIELNEEVAVAAAEKVVAAGVDPSVAIRYAIADAAIVVGEKFDSGEYYLPQLVISGDLMDTVSKVLEKNISKADAQKKKLIIVGTVQADVHSVGKNLVSTMLKAGGFQVVDLGVDVPSATFIEKAKDLNADMIALSSLLTTTMPYQREVIDDLASMGLRDRFKVMIGGGPVTKEYAAKIGADGYGKDAIEAVEVAKKLLSVE